MQGSFAAAPDQITWVLTSYIVAAAIMTAPVGRLSARFGRKTLFIACLAGFTFASVLCGLANSLEQMVMFRLLQGAFGAGLVPLSQATMLDLYPLEQRGSAMALWGVGVMVGPILGPTLGGYSPTSTIGVGCFSSTCRSASSASPALHCFCASAVAARR
jgi:MFS transporter, DHA2 family, multidrug resistance protein